MLEALVIIFWIAFFIAFYTYLGYPLLLFVIASLKGRKPVVDIINDEELPAVTVLIAAYNEERFIEGKIKNTLSLLYPKDKLSIWVVSDGSSDRTPEIARQFSSITFMDEKERRGKINVTNKFMPMIKTPVVVYSDANTFLNPEALIKVVRHYRDPKVGGVAGEKRIVEKLEDNASGAGEGLYLKYEAFIKKNDSALYSMVGATGELFSLRTELYDAPPSNMVIEDFYLSMKIPEKGYRFIYEPEAFALESASATMGDEWKRKVRISAGAFQAMAIFKNLLNPFKYGILTFQYFSHRVMRWTLAPLSLPVIFLANLALAFYGLPFYQVLFGLQCLFYMQSFLGSVFNKKKVGIKGFFVPYYFTIMNLSVYAGFFRYLKGKQTVIWEKSQRAE